MNVDDPEVCIAHGAFWVKSVRDYQSSPIETLTWEPAWETKMPDPITLPTTAAEAIVEYERLVGEKPGCRFEGRWDFLSWVDTSAPVLVCETHGDGADGLVYALPDPIEGQVGLCRPEADYLYRLLNEEANPVGRHH